MKKEYKTLLGIFIVYSVFWYVLGEVGVRISQPILKWYINLVGYIPLLILSVKAGMDQSVRMRYRALCWFLGITIIAALVSTFVAVLMGIAS